MQLQKITLFFTELFQSLFSIVKVILLSKWFTHFKKCGKDESECVILANGPCLTKDLQMHSSFISERKKFCVNFFAISDEYEKVKPDYYVLAAPEFWLKNTTNMFKQQRKNLAKDIAEKTLWNMKLFIPFASQNSKFINEVRI